MFQAPDQTLKCTMSTSIADIYFSGGSSFYVNEDSTSVTPCILSRSEVELRAYLYSSDFGKWFSYKKDNIDDI